jgi:hypothetical protein
MANNMTSFSNYDSSLFPTLPESIKHAQSNPLLIENLSDWMLTLYDTEEVLIQEPSCTLKSMVHMFDDVLETINVPTTEYYRPELTAKRLYDSYDFWYILLLVNNIYSNVKYNQPTIKYIPAKELVRLGKFAQRAKNVVRTVVDNDLTGYEL